MKVLDLFYQLCECPSCKEKYVLKGGREYSTYIENADYANKMGEPEKRRCYNCDWLLGDDPLDNTKIDTSFKRHKPYLVRPL